MDFISTVSKFIILFNDIEIKKVVKTVRFDSEKPSMSPNESLQTTDIAGDEIRTKPKYTRKTITRDKTVLMKRVFDKGNKVFE